MFSKPLLDLPTYCLHFSVCHPTTTRTPSPAFCPSDRTDTWLHPWEGTRFSQCSGGVHTDRCPWLALLLHPVYSLRISISTLCRVTGLPPRWPMLCKGSLATSSTPALLTGQSQQRLRCWGPLEMCGCAGAAQAATRFPAVGATYLPTGHCWHSWSDRVQGGTWWWMEYWLSHWILSDFPEAEGSTNERKKILQPDRSWWSADMSIFHCNFKNKMTLTRATQNKEQITQPLLPTKVLKS